jgi:hypothetical protein
MMRRDKARRHLHDRRPTFRRPARETSSGF